MQIFAHHPHDVVVIRHGQTDWNAERRLQGREDIPLNDTGRAQARRNGEALKLHFTARGADPADWDWISSPLSRAAETMRLVREEMGLDPLAFRTDARLVETAFGDWSGRLFTELPDLDPVAWADRNADQWNHRPPNGESYADAVERLSGVLAVLSRPTVLVTHGGVNRVLKVLLGVLSIAETRGFHTPQDRFYLWSGGKVEWI